MFIVVLMMIAGAVIDIGNAYRVHQQLQASADAAAAAGADNLPDTCAALATAAAYQLRRRRQEPDRRSGNRDQHGNRRLLDQPEVLQPGQHRSCHRGRDRAHHVPALIGIDSIPETVHAQACSPCGAMPLDVMIVLDRTGSMSGSKLDSAKQGILAFMKTMDPTIDNVGLAVLPPAPTTLGRM